MKMKNAIIKVVIIAMAIVLSVGPISSFAVNENANKVLQLQYFRYVYSYDSKTYEATDGYALNTVGQESHHPIYQILSTENGNITGTNYYCVNATFGQTWNSHDSGVTTPVTYNRSYDLNSQSDIDILKNDTSLSSAYTNVAKSKYLPQILWILDNIYVPDKNATKEENLEKKRALLARAGIIYAKKVRYDFSGTEEVVIETDDYTYKYVPQEGYDYTDKLRTPGIGLGDLSISLEGYDYYDSEGNIHVAELSDELVEVAQQAAIWYYTNYLENNSNNSQTYNVVDQWLQLLCSNGTSDTNSNNWPSLAGDVFNEPADGGISERVGAYKQEQASILCQYLIDAANNYAENSENTDTTTSPLTISPSKANIAEKTVDNANYYVVGPIKIETQRDSVYDLLDTISINGNTNTGAYISNAEGVKDSDQKVANHVGKDFYIAIPTSGVTGNNIKIDFEGTYKSNEKTLWISTTKEEQPIVEVTPKEMPINLTVNAELVEDKEFDLALRKAITKLTDSTGNVKLISNEDGRLATRDVTYVATDIAEEGTATYNHRKDPVVVAKGDIVTYSITIYNEGDMDGYAETIVDKLPEGLKAKESTGTYTLGNINYTYTYDEASNTITFTNVSKNVLEAYAGGDALSSETIEIECEVTGGSTTSTNTYLTNIAYITKEYNSETQEEVVTDRDSSTTNNPDAEQTTTGDSYTGYHGGDNHNGDNDKDVYTDGTNNDDYFPGREDDDDFEVVVIQPLEFDLALQKHISSIYSNGTTKEGRQEPTIDTTNLANGTATTATYTQDKTPIKVKQGDYVTYTFTVYNEGEINGYVDKITDNIPTGLQFVYQDPTQTDSNVLIAVDSQGETTEITVDDETYELVSNNSYWSLDTDGTALTTDTYNGEETISITCDVPSYLGGTNQLLEAYDSSKDNNNDGAGLDRLSVTVVLRVAAQNGSGVTIRNEAAITEAEDEEGNKQDTEDLIDRDSQTDEWPGKDGDKEYQDDEDYDNIILGKVDLALKKFIAAVSDDTQIEDGEYLTADGKVGSDTNPYTRATKVDTTELRDNPECHDATYTMVKDPLTVPAQSYVLYNIRVYNEGETDLYAGEVTDHLPDYLDYVDCEFNKEYGWKVGADGKTITTTYLSHENGEENLLKAFDKTTDDGAGSGLDYKDLQILCRVNDRAPSNTNIVNIAEITEYEDEEGEEIPEDTDSTPDNVEDEPKEDDEDNEIILIKTFDLNLLKYVSTVYVTEDGVTTETQTGNTGDDSTDTIPKVEINRKKLDSTIVKFGYTIKVTNEGDIAGYAKEITDYVPEGLRFYEEDNEGWTDEGNNVISTRLLENTLLQPGESAEVTVIFRWINGSDNLGLKTNIAEISEDYNDEGVPDRDSTPDNQVPGEDDIDEAQVLLSISTGLIGNIMMYVSAGAIILMVFAGGIILIKKFVL